MSGEGALSIFARAKELERSGRSIIHLELGEPDFHPVKPVNDALKRAIDEGKDRYCPVVGVPALREALAVYLRETRNLNISSQNIVIAPGCKIALFMAMMALIDPGDEVLYPDPGFPGYSSITLGLGGVPVPFVLSGKNHLQPDPKEIEAKITQDFGHVVPVLVMSAKDLDLIANSNPLWPKSGGVRDLGTLPGDTSSEASAINNNGDVVGYSKGPRGMRAFLWTQATGMQDLGMLPGGNSSRALGINDTGVVVGSSTSSSGDRAFIWTKETGMRDLNSAASMTLGVVFVEAHAINNAGQILVMGSPMHESHSSGEAAPQCAPAPPSSFLLTPASH